MFKHYVYKKPSVRFAMRLYDASGSLLRKKRKPRVITEPQRICVVVLHQIGDVVMSLPTIEMIATMFPQAKLSIISGQGPAPLFENNPWGAKVYPFDALWQKVVRQLGGKQKAQAAIKQSKQTFLSLIKEINPDVVVVFHPDLTVNQLLGKTSVPHTFSFTNAGGGFRVTHPIPMPQRGHQVERNHSLAKALATTFHKKLPARHEPKLTVTKREQDQLLARLHQEKIDLEPKKLVILHPFASAETKNWLPDRWETIMDWLLKQGFSPAIIGGPNDRFPFENPDLEQQVHNLAGKLTLHETQTLLSLARVFIGIDSGPGHIAAAVSCPVVSIFSSVNDPTRWHPYGVKNKTIILHHPVQDKKRFPYEMRDLPGTVQGNPYSDQITTEEVLTALEKIVA